MKKDRLHKRDLAWLSAYLDDELNTSQRQALKARLQHEPGLRDHLENLRRTKVMVSYLPHLRAPRHYTLTPEMVTVRSPKKQPLLGSLRLASVLAAFLLMVSFGVEFLLASGPLAQPRMAAKPMLEEYHAMEVAVLEDEPEPLIVWGESDGQVDGMGEGVDVMEEPVMVESMPVEPEAAVEEEILPEEEPELLMEAEMLSPGDEEAEPLRLDPDYEEKTPILGINEAESGEIINRSADSFVEEMTTPTWRLVLRVIQVALGTAVIGGGLAWWLLRRRLIS